MSKLKENKILSYIAITIGVAISIFSQNYFLPAPGICLLRSSFSLFSCPAGTIISKEVRHQTNSSTAFLRSVSGFL